MKPGDIKRELDLAHGRIKGVKTMVTDALEENKMEMLVPYEQEIKNIIEVGVDLLRFIENYRKTRA